MIYGEVYMRSIAILITGMILLTNCMETTTKKTVKSPYNSSFVSDPELYGVVFQEIYEQLAYYMEWNLSMISTNEIALILEVEASSDFGSASDILNGPIMNGWTIIEFDAVDLTPTQIASLSATKVDASIRNLPTAKFFVDYDGTECSVYAYFWLLERFGYNHHYVFKKNITGAWGMKDNAVTTSLLQ